MILSTPLCAVREWRVADLDRLVRLADDREIWRNLYDRFPNPYTRTDGEAWLTRVISQRPMTHFAIEVEGQLAGSIGVNIGTDIHSRSGEIGYWLGREYWGRGIATEALKAFAPWSLASFGLIKIYAGVFTWNPKSGNVLEKAGFRLEGHFRKSAWKDGQAVDELYYGMVAEGEGDYFTPTQSTAIAPSA